MEITEGSRNEIEITEEVTQKKGGLKSLPFIMANEILEKVASSGLYANMPIYLTDVYHMSKPTSSIYLFIWGAISSLMPLFGAYVSDTYFGRFVVITIGSIACLIGITILWFTTMISGAIPPRCNSGSSKCKGPTVPQHIYLCLAFAFLSIGTGGISPCSIAFGADQLRKKKDKKALQKYFSWYYASVGISFAIATTVIVFIEQKFGWRIGFAVLVVLMTISVVVFVLGSNLYIKVKGNKSLIAELLWVVRKALKNRHVDLPKDVNDGIYLGYKLLVPTEELRFFNKACIISNTNKDTTNTTVSAPDSLCSVEQVESLKAVIRILPMWSTSVVMFLMMSQTFPTLQADAMDRHLFPGFSIPPATFSIFGTISMTLWSGCYDPFIVPVLKKLTGNPRGLSHKQRISIGIITMTAVMVVSAIVEFFRRRAIIISARWLIPQNCLIGLAEAFAIIGQLEFYYSQLPKGMASFGLAFVSLGWGAADYIGIFVILVVKKLSRIGGGDGWLTDDMNKGHYDYYYLVLAGLGVLDFVWFLFCNKVYREESNSNVWEEEDE